MKKNLHYFLFSLFVLLYANAQAQDTLPNITVKNISNNIIVSWVNNYGGNIATINIQRSYDSLKNFTTIGSVLDPMSKENGYVDNKAPKATMFYRVFIAFEGGQYIFTKSKRPTPDTLDNRRLPPVKPEEITKQSNGKPAITTSPSVLVKPDVPLIPPYIPSRFIYLNKENNVTIELPEVNSSSKYSVKFFDENDQQLFEIKKLTEPFLVIEKVNFKHSGWFYFKLYQDGIMREKNQFYIPKDGKTGIPSSEMNKRF